MWFVDVSVVWYAFGANPPIPIQPPFPTADKDVMPAGIYTAPKETENPIDKYLAAPQRD